MPFQRIDLLAGRTLQARQSIADAVHRALVEAVGVPEKDRFQIMVEHGPNALIFTPEFLGVSHHSPVMVQVTFTKGRTSEAKRDLYKRMAELLEEAGVPPNDLIVNLVEVAKEDWSFGGGVAYYAPSTSPSTEGR